MTCIYIFKFICKVDKSIQPYHEYIAILFKKGLSIMLVQNTYLHITNLNKHTTPKVACKKG